MNFYQHPEAFRNLRNTYVLLRLNRITNTAARRKYYRRIKAERERLESIGYIPEHLRLYCRYLSNPFPESPALKRLRAFEAMMVELARVQSTSFLNARTLVVHTNPG